MEYTRTVATTLTIALAVLIGASRADADGGDLFVLSLRVDPLPLLTCDDQLKKEREATKSDLVQPWPAQQDQIRPDILRVTVQEHVYCVKAFTVETSRPVAANPEEGRKACGPDQRRGMGGTRNLGKECKK